MSRAGTECKNTPPPFQGASRAHRTAEEVSRFATRSARSSHKGISGPTHVLSVNHFWKEIDRDNSGHVNFEEFLEWWLKHFDESGHVGSLPYDDFYKEMRDIGEIEMDPPASPPVFKTAEALFKQAIIEVEASRSRSATDESAAGDSSESG